MTELIMRTRFIGPHWANFIKRFSEGEVSRLDAKYDANGELHKLWADIKRFNELNRRRD